MSSPCCRPERQPSIPVFAGRGCVRQRQAGVEGSTLCLRTLLLVMVLVVWGRPMQDAPVPPERLPETSRPSAPPQQWDWLQLQALPLIGPRRAQDLVEARQAGRWERRPLLEAWDEVRGVGPGTLEQVRAALEADGRGAYTQDSYTSRPARVP